MLKLRSHLERMQGRHTIVVIAAHEQHSGIDLMGVDCASTRQPIRRPCPPSRSSPLCKGLYLYT